jgi:hypothetical protein
VDASTSIDELRAALHSRTSLFGEAIEEIQRRGASASVLQPDLVPLLDDSSKCIVVLHGRAPSEMEADYDLYAPEDLARWALHAIGAQAAAYLESCYRTSSRKAHFARAVAALGVPGFAALAAILRETQDEAVCKGALFAFQLYVGPSLYGPRFDRLRTLARDARLDLHARAEMLDELERLVREP